MISSAQVLRDLQTHFNPSELFAPWLSTERSARSRESHNQRKRRREKDPQVKIGHGGTLDPLATGVLIAGVGKGTKALQRFLLCTKTYEAVILFGASTDSYDRLGKIIRTAPYEHVTKQSVEKELERFRGKFMQLPPLFSALKMNGKPLYEYAREGKQIPREIERREVEVLNLELVEWMEGGTHPHEAPSELAGYAEINVAQKLWKQEGALPASRPEDESKEGPETRKRKPSHSQDDLVTDLPSPKHRKLSSPEEPTMSGGLDAEPPMPQAAAEAVPTPALKGPPAAKIRMTVTSGFYVRSLCHDLGAAVGSAALMAELKRTQQGQFEIGENVLEYSDLEKGEEVWGPKVEAMLDDWYYKEEQPRNNLVGGADTKATKTEQDASDNAQGKAKPMDDKEAAGNSTKEKALPAEALVAAVADTPTT
jgi:tRNA pseudouridine55 synthase